MWILLIVAVAVVAAVAFVYNQLVRLRVQAQNAWSDIDVQLKRRHELVPNLVAVVSGYAEHESQTLRQVTEARTRAVAARDGGPAERARAESELSRALEGLSIRAEAYPDLRASGNFLHLQESLSTLEDAIQNARRYYNAVVRDLNTKIQQFPTNLIAGIFGFREREFFGAAEAEREAPSVRLDAPPATD